ncbi:MAG: VOC family protein [Myxococcales bacterium]|nr:VOC family protein [Myxococcales bacterium]
MPEIKSHEPGTFCWIDLATTDPKGAKRFYSDLFGWTTEDLPVPGNVPYTMARVQGKDVAGLAEMQPELRAKGVPPHWSSYVAVTNADETAKKAQSLGAKVLMPAFDVMDVGRMAMLEDPTGANFSLWQARKHHGALLVGEVGAFCWNELMTRDVDRAGGFYSKLFGWKARVDDFGKMKYTTFLRGETPVGGMMAMPKEAGEAPSHWTVYFSVADCDRSAEKLKSLKGKVLVPPQDIEKVGRFAMVQDPQGATFGIIKTAPGM